MAEVLSQINNFGDWNLTKVVAGALHVYGYEFVANLRCELTVVDLCEFAALAPALIAFELLAHLFLVIELAVKFFAFVFCALLPAIHIEAVSEHKDKLGYF